MPTKEWHKHAVEGGRVDGAPHLSRGHRWPGTPLSSSCFRPHLTPSSPDFLSIHAAAHPSDVPAFRTCSQALYYFLSLLFFSHISSIIIL